MSDDVGVGTGIRFDELGAVVFLFCHAAGWSEFAGGEGSDGAGGDGLPD